MSSLKTSKNLHFSKKSSIFVPMSSFINQPYEAESTSSTKPLGSESVSKAESSFSTKESLSFSPVYKAVGASSSKEDVYKALSVLPRGVKKIGTNPFCTLWPDLSGDTDYCSLLHADGAGTKASLAYIYWRETGDISVWAGIAEDALVMNTDDAICAGAVKGPLLFSSNIARNKRYIPTEVLRELLRGTEAFVQRLCEWGVEATFCGGETADVGDLVGSILVDATLMTRLRRTDIIDNANIKEDDLIIGLGSEGSTAYDPYYNSGIGSNGLALARHVLFHKQYAEQYPESYDNNLQPGKVAYRGPYKLEDPLSGTSLSVGKAALSPTRSYLPFLRKVLQSHRSSIHGLVHCTGSGQTKLLRALQREKYSLHIIKDKLFPVPPIFSQIQKAGQVPWREMYQIFNMGHRMELYTDKKTAKEVLDTAKNMQLPAQVVGKVKHSPTEAPRGRISLQGPKGLLQYDA